MSGEVEKFIIDIVARENRRHGDIYNLSTLSPLSPPQGQEATKDSARHYKVSGVRSADDAIISISNARFPNAIGDAVERGAKIAARVEPGEAKSIVGPICVGRHEKQSYAFWPEYKTLSKNRLLRKIQILSINQSVLEWLCNNCKGSSRAIESDEDLHNRYIAPIRYLISDSGVSADVKAAATDALNIVEGGDFQAVSVAQHGDFWRGNILLSRRWPLRHGDDPVFYVIDWGGSNINGYPYADLVRYLISIGVARGHIADAINKYSVACGLKNEQVRAYICASIGYLGMNRHEFPADIYLRLCETMIGATPTPEMMGK